MKKNKLFILLGILTIIVLVASILLFKHNETLRDNKIKIIDATYNNMCASALEKFYEDDNYTYSFPCVKSNSVFVILPDGKKMLVVTALDTGIVTIDELIDAGLEVIKEAK